MTSPVLFLLSGLFVFVSVYFFSKELLTLGEKISHNDQDQPALATSLTEAYREPLQAVVCTREV